MLLEEAIWLRDRLADVDIDQLSPMLDIGSSTRSFRTVTQPYIDDIVFEPLKKRGCAVLHVDLKEADGVDVIADIFSDVDCERLRRRQPKSLLCASLLEHIHDPAAAVQRFFQLLPEDGILFLTVPYSFPRHTDPIDTMFRPSPSVLEDILQGLDVQRCEVVTGKTLIGELRARRAMRRANEPILGEGWRPHAETFWHLFWLLRPYRMTCAMAVKRKSRSRHMSVE